MSLQIIYTTQTKNTKPVAEKLLELLSSKLQVNSIMSTKDITADKITSNFVYLTSTCGDGDHPSMATRAMNFFVDTDEFKEVFAGKKFAVFGIGSTGHEKFNYAAIEADQAFAKQGGIRVADLVKFDRKGSLVLDTILEKFAQEVIEEFK